MPLKSISGATIKHELRISLGLLEVSAIPQLFWSQIQDSFEFLRF